MTCQVYVFKKFCNKFFGLALFLGRFKEKLALEKVFRLNNFYDAKKKKKIQLQSKSTLNQEV